MQSILFYFEIAEKTEKSKTVLPGNSCRTSPACLTCRNKMASYPRTKNTHNSKL